MGFSVASLLIKLRPCEKRRRGRGLLFCLAQRRPNPVDDVLVLNTSEDSDGSAAATANLNVDIEHALELLGPGHSRMTLDR